MAVALRPQQEARFGSGFICRRRKEIRRAPDIGELFFEKRQVQDKAAPRAPKPDEFLVPFGRAVRIERLPQSQRGARPIMPVEKTLCAEDVGLRFCVDVADFQENPLELSRFGLEDLLEHIEIFRRIHSVDAEIKGPGRDTIFAGGPIENFRRNGVVEAARAEKKRVEFVLVLGENPQLFHHSFGNGRGQQGMINRARGQKGAEAESNADESIQEWFVHAGSSSSSFSFSSSIFQRRIRARSRARARERFVISDRSAPRSREVLSPR